MLEPARTVSIFQKQPQHLHVRAGDLIFQPGEIGEVMYGVIEGTVELMANGKVVETIQSGDVFGEGALVHPSRTRVTTAIAKTDCVLACLDKQRFLFAVQNTPMFAIEIMQSFSERLRRLKQNL
jgi:CRP/FNR family transcriptional regulator, cyclic AMP receptor protein